MCTTGFQSFPLFLDEKRCSLLFTVTKAGQVLQPASPIGDQTMALKPHASLLTSSEYFIATPDQRQKAEFRSTKSTF